MDEKKILEKKAERIFIIDDVEFTGAVADELLLEFQGAVIPPRQILLLSCMIKEYNVTLHSQPASGRDFKEGTVPVNAENEQEAINSAIEKMVYGSMNLKGLYPRNAWIIDRVELIFKEA